MSNPDSSRKSIDAKKLSIALFVSLSFLIQVFTHILASNTLLIIALTGLSLLIILLNKPFTDKQLSISFLWISAYLGMLLSYIRGPLNVNNLVDLFVFFAGISLILAGGSESESFEPAMKIIIFFATFYAVSVWIQILFPAFYQGYVNLLPVRNRISILRYAGEGRFFTGFSSNPGFTAGYIVCGILLLVSKVLSDPTRKEKLKYIFISVFLMISLFMTGRRAHFVFMLVAIIAIYLLPHKGEIKRRVLKLGLIFLILIFTVIIFKDHLVEIPLFSRISLSIEGLILGEDITTGRSDLYAHAWSLFLDNPIFGIGWGNFRLSVVGNITIMTEMEVHNIYLQMLCEMGIIGFILFIVPILCYLILTIRSLRRNLKRKDQGTWPVILYYSLAYQVFFIFYGLTGNPLYDPNFLMMYFLACAITTVYLRFEKADRIRLVKKDSIRLNGMPSGRSACGDKNLL